MSELPYKRVLVDSRHRTSGSSTDFVYQLPQTMHCGPNTYCSLTDCLIPVAWWTVELDVNDRIAVVLNGASHETKITAGRYTSKELGEEVALRLTIYCSSLPGGNAHHNLGFTSSYNDMPNQVAINTTPAINWHFEMSDAASKVNNPHGILGLTLERNGPVAAAYASPYQFMYPDVRHIHQILLQSDTLGQSETLGLYGPISLLKRIPINALYGQVQWYEGYHPADRINVSNEILSQLHFKLTKFDGTPVDLHDSDVSFSLLFE